MFPLFVSITHENWIITSSWFLLINYQYISVTKKKINIFHWNMIFENVDLMSSVSVYAWSFSALSLASLTHGTPLTLFLTQISLPSPSKPCCLWQTSSTGPPTYNLLLRGFSYSISLWRRSILFTQTRIMVEQQGWSMLSLVTHLWITVWYVHLNTFFY